METKIINVELPLEVFEEVKTKRLTHGRVKMSSFNGYVRALIMKDLL